jgi:hypothetical protein
MNSGVNTLQNIGVSFAEHSILLHYRKTFERHFHFKLALHLTVQQHTFRDKRLNGKTMVGFSLFLCILI